MLNKKSSLRIGILFTVILIVFFISVFINRKQQSICFNGLTIEQNIQLAEWYHLQCDKDLTELTSQDHFLFEKTPKTDDVFKRMIACLFWQTNLGKPIPEGELFETGKEFLRLMDKYLPEIGDGELTVDELNGDLVLQNPCGAYHFYDEMPNYLLTSIEFQIDGLNYVEYIDFCFYYGIAPQKKGDIYVYDGQMAMFPHETAQIVEALNSQLWDDEMSDTPEHQKAMNMLQQVGISKENPITVEWVLEHPQEAYNFILTYKNIRSLYDRIFIANTDQP